MKSFRTSTQSVSKRSSDYSVQSSTKSSSSNSEIAFSISESAAVIASGATTTTGEYQQISQSVSHSSRSTSTTTTSTTTGYSSSELEQSLDPDLAPALPPKSNQRGTLTRHESASAASSAAPDELDEASSGGWASHRSSQSEVAELRTLSPLQQHHLQQQHHHHHPHTCSAQQLQQWQSKHHSLIEGPRLQLAGSGSCSAFDQRHLEEPPPLPMKKKHSKWRRHRKHTIFTSIYFPLLFPRFILHLVSNVCVF